MTRFLLTALILLIPASFAAAGHREIFRSRQKVTETTVITQTVRSEARLFGIVVKPVRAVVRVATAPVRAIPRIRGGSGCAGVTVGGGCIGTVTAVRAPVRTGAGCSGMVGPALVVQPPKVLPQPMPIVPHKK